MYPKDSTWGTDKKIEEEFERIKKEAEEKKEK